jgi:Ca2+-binding RTX toxin-like protein
MAFDYSVSITDPQDASATDDALLTTDMDAALADWSQYITGLGTLEVAIDLVSSSFPGELASGAPTVGVVTGTAPDGAKLATPSSVYELLTGQHAAGASSDITVYVDPANLPELYLNPDPQAGGAVPANLYDMVTIFRHELAHGFGMSGFYDQGGSPAYGGQYQSTFDQYIQAGGGGSAWFTGPTAEGVYGGPIPLTNANSSEFYYHFANNASDPLANDLMSGLGLSAGTSRDISAFDLAVLKDAGVPITAGLGFAITPPIVSADTLVQATLAQLTPPGGTEANNFSPDGSDFPAAIGGDLNVATVTDPSPGSDLALPPDYQALIVDGAAPVTLFGTGLQSALLQGNSGNDTIVAGQGDETIVSGTGSNLIGLSGPDTLLSQGTDTVIGGGSPDTIYAAGSVLAFGGGGPLTFLNGNNASTVIGGTGAGPDLIGTGPGGGLFAGGSGGNNVIIGGSGAATIFGAGSGDLLFAAGSAPDTLIAGPGNETLVGAGSAGADTFYAGSGDDLMGGGSGRETFFGGTGSSTIIGGSGPDVYAFVNGLSSGGSDVIFGFNAAKGDSISLGGYGGNELSNALAHAAVGGGNTTITLSDHTTITFVGVTSSSALV